MKKTLLLSTLLILFQSLLFAQHKEKVQYNFLVNEVPEGFDMPMIGLVNTAHGDQGLIQIGLINTSEGNLEGGQVGFINDVGRDMKGLQTGFINVTGHNQVGIQAGFINSVDQNFQGLQMGFINVVEDRFQGIQAGFINAVEKVEGFQLGFINATENLKGFQVGFINAAERASGSQIGFLNGAEVLDGLQIGFINRVERVSHGTPIGFLSFVKHGGLKAIEFGFTEMYPYNLSYKTGTNKFYTFPMLSYNPNLPKPVAIGFGAGSILPMNEEVYFNPELMSQNVISYNFSQITSLSLNFGHSFNEHTNVLIGPSVVWNKSSNNTPLFSLKDWTIDANNRIHLGMRAAIRYRF